MLQELYLENYVLFEKASLDFSSGLNAISGETGAGKSLIAGAISLALGERAKADVIRSGADSAVVSAVFHLDGKTTKSFINETGLEPDDNGNLLFERTIRREGGSKLSINGRPASAASARSAAEHILDIAAQNEHTRITEPAYQQELLDKFGKLEKDVAEYGEAFAKAASLLRRLEAGDSEKERVRRRIEQINDDLELIAQAGYDSESDPYLEDRIRTLSHSEAISAICQKGVDSLYEGEDSIQDALSSLIRETESMTDNCPALKEALECLNEAAAGIDEAVRSYRETESSIDCSPGELESTIERAEMLKKIARRLGCDIAELPEKQDNLSRELDELSGWETDTDEVKEQLNKLLKNVRELGLSLRAKREKVGKKLAKSVAAELNDLEMEQAGFYVELRPLWAEGKDKIGILKSANAGGLDEVEFMLTPNPGEAPSSLSASASGGEASRAMLAVKSALSATHFPPVLFFDEIDAGIGGRLGDTIGAKLSDLAKDRQVIAITHLPQLAAHAKTHLKVSKKVDGKRTTATIESIDGEARVEEIAQMIRGKASTATTMAQAREMLDKSTVK
ncbi:MAG: DNA repair protein RecN [Planctomycetes bacterium]|nr:DNA repair protein RecN [Planctomycetota bacterium]